MKYRMVGLAMSCLLENAMSAILSIVEMAVTTLIIEFLMKVFLFWISFMAPAIWRLSSRIYLSELIPQVWLVTTGLFKQAGLKFVFA